MRGARVFLRDRHSKKPAQGALLSAGFCFVAHNGSSLAGALVEHKRPAERKDEFHRHVRLGGEAMFKLDRLTVMVLIVAGVHPDP